MARKSQLLNEKPELIKKSNYVYKCNHTIWIAYQLYYLNTPSYLKFYIYKQPIRAKRSVHLCHLDNLL